MSNNNFTINLFQVPKYYIQLSWKEVRKTRGSWGDKKYPQNTRAGNMKMIPTNRNFDSLKA